jgi:thymidylate kinase
MQSTLATAQAPSAGPRPEAPGPGRILRGVLETLEEAGVACCLLHGYEGYPWRVESDVDAIVSGKLRPRQLVALLHENRARLGAEVVLWRDYYIVLAGKGADGAPCCLQLDLGVNFELAGRHFYAGHEVLAGRRRHRELWAPAPHVEFACYLIKRIVKGDLDDEQGRRLAELYRQAPEGCRREVARFWAAGSSALIVAAAESGDWAPVRGSLARLGREARRRAALRHPWRAVRGWLGRLAGRVKQLYRPDTGLEVVVLGPDGAGKSSVVQAVRQGLESAFFRTSRCRFPPAVLSRLLRRPEPPPEKRPHGSPPRSLLASVVRALGYWFLYYSPGYWVTVRPALARGTLVLHDRHLIDALVDPLRYRYGGPGWLLRLIWRLVPGPGLVVLLDAPPEVLQARKQEVPFEETARQRQAYRALVASLGNGHVVDVNRPLEQVVGEVSAVILRYQAARITHRLRLRQNG